MKVLFVYKYLTLGGVEAVLRTRLDHLDEFGIESKAWFLSYIDGASILDPKDTNVSIGDINQLHVNILESDYSLVSSIDTEEIFPVMKKLNTDVKFVVESHSPYRENLEYLRYIEDTPIIALYVPSHFQREFIQPYLTESIPINIIPNPLPVQFTSHILQFKPQPEPPIIAWIGRLDSLKNWKEFFALAGLLLEKHNELQIWVAGRAVSKRTGYELYKAAKKHKLLPRLRWFMSLPYTRIPTFLDAVRSSGGVVVSTSKGESFGMTVAEAMARECAVVAPDYGPFPEFVEDGVSGYLYKPGIVRDVVEKTSKLLSMSDLRYAMGQQARETILRSHGTKQALGSLATSFGEIINVD